MRQENSVMSDAETRLRSNMCKNAEKQGFFAANINDRFISGYPDMRFARKDLGQLDVELKILGCADSSIANGREVDSGITPLQQITIREMNNHGAAAVGLILLPDQSKFVFCNFRRICPRAALAWGSLPHGGTGRVDFERLFRMSFSYLLGLYNE